MTVENKHILITGGGSGIGAAVARLTASRGALVGVADVHSDNARDVVADIERNGGRAYAVSVDVTSAEAIADMFKVAAEKSAVLDVLINNAGVDHLPAPMHEVSDEALMRNIDVNLIGVWRCMRRAIGTMLGQGHGQIINLASVAGLRSAPMISAYSATKHAVIGLTRSTAVEYARANIRINAVCPSFVDTPMVQGVLSHMDERGRNGIIRANPMKRLGKPDEISGAIAWLCSDESSFMTGQSVVLDGGMLA
ncbi:SDR family NAD(P)-dependent oxidoreductase [Alteromonas halophila]|uniref:Short-chain dehydrogenase n=1 Tax=Alteromonas halophila TaxID=516698 RepID=A0A918N1R7_9ALTE|nr:SDR family NAD(P)-dependent oxidoreductase [Alteromonas halophila]GGW95580.1 short-chain dehydrogenase [Alteromonas halophila]